MTRRYFAQGEQIDGAAYFYSFDHLGSIRDLTDITGAVRAKYDYDLWGRQTKLAGDLESDFGYTGIFRHIPSGLNLTWFRAYQPSLARWISRDPLAEQRPGLNSNVYVYARNSPANYFDPDGRDPIGGAITGALGGFWGASMSGKSTSQIIIATLVGGTVGGLVGIADVSDVYAGVAGAAAGAYVSGVAKKMADPKCYGNPWQPDGGEIVAAGAAAAASAALASLATVRGGAFALEAVMGYLAALLNVDIPNCPPEAVDEPQ